MGAPVSGKSTTLIDIARKFHRFAVKDSKAPIPLLFNLSLWGRVDRETERPIEFVAKATETTRGNAPPIEEWLGQMVAETPGTGVSKSVAREWLEAGNVAILLDGLDEANEKLRSALVRALNDYLEKNPGVPAIICSRIADYEALVETTSVKLALNTAVTIQSLTPEQISEYLDAAQAGGMSRLLLKFVQQALLVEQATQPWPSVQGRG